MPIPTEFVDKQLIGSRWIRRIGKHRGTEVTITQFNEAGVKFEVRTRTAPGARSHLGDKRLGSVQWPMFTTLYEPEGILPMIVTIDKEGFVQKAVSEYARPVVTEGTIKKEEDMPEPVAPVRVDMQICRGPWHYKGGKGTALPLADFDSSTRYKGQLNKTCRSCIERTATFDKRDKRYNGAATRVPANAILKAPEPLKIDPVVEVPQEPVTNAPGRYQWKVTIIQPVERLVWADDFLDASTAVGEGEVVKVERL